MSIDDDMPAFTPPRNHNNPPSPIELAATSKAALDKYLDEHPVIQDEAEARGAKLVYDLAQAALGDLETARESETKPLHAAWQAMLDKYRKPVATFAESVKLLYGRMQAFAREQRDLRQKEAADAARIAEEARQAAVEAERKEKEAIENASLGEIGAGVSQAKEEADRKFAEFERANREARVAERDTKVTIGGGFGKAMGVKVERTLVLDDVNKAIAALGVTDDIKAAVLKSARAYKKLHSKWPDGVHEDVN